MAIKSLFYEEADVMLNLDNVMSNIKELTELYHLCENNNHYLFDGDLEELFNASNIRVGKTLHKAKNWEYDEDGWLTGCKDGNYLETIELIQNKKVYLCQVFSDRCGDGLDYMLDLLNVTYKDDDCVLREKQNIFFLNDIDGNNIDAVIISSTSTKSDIQKAIHHVKLSIEDYTLDNIIENLPSDCKLYHRWSSETVYY